MMVSLPSALENTPAYADPWPNISDALDELLPVERVKFSDYAAEHRYLNNTGGGFIGRWSHDVVSYLVEPMDMLNSRVYTMTAIVGRGQPAKTTTGEKRRLHTDAFDPGRLLRYRAPTQPFQAGLGRRT